MEMTKIERVIVGNEMDTTAEIQSEFTILESHQTDKPQCFDCLITFSEHKSYKRHMKKHHPVQYSNHLQQNHILFTCFKCDKNYSSPEELRKHQIDHSTEKKPFPCSQCKKRFGSYSEVRHHRRYDCEKMRFCCEDCGAGFISTFQRYRHRIAVHAPNKDRKAKSRKNMDLPTKDEEEYVEAIKQEEEEKGCNKSSDSQAGASFSAGLPICHSDDKMIKQEKEERRCGKHSDSQNGRSSVELKIPCPVDDCVCVFPSVAALRMHKKEHHKT